MPNPDGSPTMDERAAAGRMAWLKAPARKTSDKKPKRGNFFSSALSSVGRQKMVDQRREQNKDRPR